jgi:hypothetical protein
MKQCDTPANCVSVYQQSRIGDASGDSVHDVPFCGIHILKLPGQVTARGCRLILESKPMAAVTVPCQINSLPNIFCRV